MIGDLFSQFAEINSKKEESKQQKFISEIIPKRPQKNEFEEIRDKIKAALSINIQGLGTDLILLTESVQGVESIRSQMFFAAKNKFIMKPNQLLYLFEENLYIYDNYKIFVLTFHMEKQVFLLSHTLFLNDAERSPELLFFSRKDGGTSLLILSKSESRWVFSLYDISQNLATISQRNLLPLDEKIKKPIVFTQENGLYIVDFSQNVGQGFNLEEIIEKSFFFQPTEGKSYSFICENKEFSPDYKFTIKSKIYLQGKEQDKLWSFEVDQLKSLISLVKSDLKSPKLLDKGLVPSNVYSCGKKLYVLSSCNDSGKSYLQKYDL